MPTISAPPPPATTIPSQIQEAEVSSLSPEEIKIETLNAFKDIATEYLEEERKAAILKRLSALETSWDDKDEVLIKRLHSLAQGNIFYKFIDEKSSQIIF